MSVGDHYFSVDPGSRLERGLVRSRIRGRKYEFITAVGLFSYKKIDNGTRLLAENMTVPTEGSLLDMGCGFGVLGLVAATLNPELRVVLTDVNKRAVMISRENVERLRLRNVEVRGGSLYEPVEDMMFDTVVSNPPISAGMRRVVKPLVEGASVHLKSGGSLQVVVQSRKGGAMLAGYVDEVFGGHSVAAKGSGYRVLCAVKS